MEQKLYKDSKLIRDLPVALLAAKNTKMNFYILRLREHKLFDLNHDWNYVSGTYRLNGDTLILDPLKKVEVLDFKYGIINKKDSVLYLIRKQNEDSIRLKIFSIQSDI